MHNIITALLLSLMATTVAAQETLTKKPDFLNAVAGHVLEIGLLRVQL